MFSNYLYTSSTSKVFRTHFINAAKNYINEFKLNSKKSYIIDVGSNDGVALKPFKDLKFKNILGIEPAKNLAKIANNNKIKTLNGFLNKQYLKKIKKVIGKDTNTAVRSGFFWGYAGLIDNIVNLIMKETRKSFKLVITGGFSDLFKKSIKTKLSQNKDITIKGLIKISKLIK